MSELKRALTTYLAVRTPHGGIAYPANHPNLVNLWDAFESAPPSPLRNLVRSYLLGETGKYGRKSGITNYSDDRILLLLEGALNQDLP